MQTSDKTPTNNIEWTPKNIVILSIAILFLIGGILYGTTTASNDLAEKRQKLMAMTLDEVGAYILDKNQGTVVIDPITKVRDMRINGNTLELPYYVSEGFLQKFSSALESEENTKLRVQKDTLYEDCSKTSFSVFLEKGGIMHYTYRLEDRHSSKYLYDFNNTWEMCPNMIE